MELIISLVLAFFLSAISQVMKDLGQQPLHKPGWAMNPTLGGAIFAALTWFIRPFVDTYYSTGQRARAAVFGILGVLLQLGGLTAFFWGAIILAGSFFDSLILQVIVVTAIFFIGGPIVLPIISLLLIPITLIISLPLDLLFPIKRSKESEEVIWCKNCKHYKKAKDYEDVIKGLWRSEEMPRSDKLPCTIVAEAIDTWEIHYEAEPSKRTLFPKDCSVFERA